MRRTRPGRGSREEGLHDVAAVRLPRQESECELFSDLWRLKCGKSGQESQRGTTDLLLLRKEKINNVK